MSKNLVASILAVVAQSSAGRTIITHGAVLGRGVALLGKKAPSEGAHKRFAEFVDAGTSKRCAQVCEHSGYFYHEVRRASGLDERGFTDSILSMVPFATNSLGSRGKEFFVTADDEYLVKSVSAQEMNQLAALLPKYLAHLKAHPRSLLARLCGCYTVKCADGQRPPLGLRRATSSRSYLVMKSTFPSRLRMNRRYDLKGSTLGRWASGRDGGVNQSGLAPDVVLKDRDFMDDASSRLRLPPENRELVLKQLETDVQFLRNVSVMDYSLLCGVHSTKFGVLGALSCQAGFLVSRLFRAVFKHDIAGRAPLCIASFDGRSTFYIGVIDFLQTYSFKKRLETWWKCLAHERASISCVDPELYSRRFLSFLSETAFPRSF